MYAHDIFTLGGGSLMEIYTLVIKAKWTNERNYNESQGHSGTNIWLMDRERESLVQVISLHCDLLFG